jgi:hypothetical protein
MMFVAKTRELKVPHLVNLRYYPKISGMPFVTTTLAYFTKERRKALHQENFTFN